MICCGPTLVPKSINRIGKKFGTGARHSLCFAEHSASQRLVVSMLAVERKSALNGLVLIQVAAGFSDGPISFLPYSPDWVTSLLR